MNTLHFKYAVEVERTGSITQAADNLYMAQPNLSKAIKELEDTLGIPIFTRTSRGMVPTQKGSEFLVYAKNILTQVSEMEALYISDNGEKQRFSIVIPRGSYISSAFTRFVAELDPELEIDVDVKETNSMQAISDVAGGDYGIGIIRYQTFHERYFIDFLLSKDLAFDPIWEFKYLALMSRCHPLADEPEISFTEPKPLYRDRPRRPGRTVSDRPRAQKREIRRASQEEDICLRTRAASSICSARSRRPYMWVSPIPEIWLTRYDLVQRKCTQAVNKYKDVLIYPKNYEFSQLDKKYLDKLYESKNEVALKIYA